MKCHISKERELNSTPDGIMTDDNMQMSLMPICWYGHEKGSKEYERVITFGYNKMNNRHTPPRLYTICKWRKQSKNDVIEHAEETSNTFFREVASSIDCVLH